MTDRLSTLRLFASVIKLRSISAAARSHGISTTTGSRRIQDLEASLGIALIDRTTRKLAPTEAGARLYARINDALGSLDTAMREAGENDTTPMGTLRVLARRSFAMRHVRPMIPSFLTANPQVTVDLELTERVDIAPGDAVDVVIRLGPSSGKSIISHTLASAQRILCGSPDYLAAHGMPLTIEALQDHACLTYRRASEPATWIFEELTTAGPREREIEIHGPLRATSGEVLREAAIAGMGLVLLPAWMVANDVAAGKLVQCLAKTRAWPAGFNDEIVIAYRRREYIPAKVKAFVEAMRAIDVERAPRP